MSERNGSDPLARDIGQRKAWNLLHDRTTVISVLIVLFTLAFALFGKQLYTFGIDPQLAQARDGIFQDYDAINAAPNATHWLGADYLGRDVFTRLAQAIRVSLLVAMVVELINIGLGGTLGLLAGTFGGAADVLISRAADMFFAFPGLLLAILVSAVFGESAREAYGGTGRLLLVAGSLSLVSWPLMARLIRGETLSIKNRDYVLAARGLGASSKEIIVRHILPNVAWLLIVTATLDVASVIVNEATLSLLGLGIEEPGSSLGLMIFRAVGNIERYPLQVLIPGVVITILVLAFSFLGDGIRDALDPHSRR